MKRIVVLAMAFVIGFVVYGSRQHHGKVMRQRQLTEWHNICMDHAKEAYLSPIANRRNISLAQMQRNLGCIANPNADKGVQP